MSRAGDFTLSSDNEQNWWELGKQISLLISLQEVQARVLDEILDKMSEIQAIYEKKLGTA